MLITRKPGPTFNPVKVYLKSQEGLHFFLLINSVQMVLAFYVSSLQ